MRHRGRDSSGRGLLEARAVIQITPQMRILLAVEPVDFRRGIDGLAAVCRATLGVDPLAGALFVFRSRSCKALKLLMYDGQGFWLCQNRLVSHCPLRAGSKIVVPPPSALWRWNRAYGCGRTSIRHDRGTIAGRIASRDSGLDVRPGGVCHGSRYTQLHRRGEGTPLDRRPA